MVNNFSSARRRFVSAAFLEKIDRLKIEEAAHSIEFVRTSDDWQLALLRYSKPEQVTRKLPVLLCHGLGCSHFSFDVNRQFSIVRHLVAQGFDVYCIDLRGHGYSQKAKQGNDYGIYQNWGYGFNDYLNQDLPAALARVCKLAGSEQVHYLGHSMGGILLFAYAAIGGNLVKCGVTFGSSLDYSGLPTIFRPLLPLLKLVSWAPFVPLNLDALLSGKLAGIHPKLVNKIYAASANCDHKIISKVLQSAFTPVSMPVLKALAQAINGEGMRTDSGQKYSDLLQQRGYDFDILSISGEADIQCLPPTAARFGTEQLVLGKTHQCQHDYGHHDLIVGNNATTEVYPKVVDFLLAHE